MNHSKSLRLWVLILWVGGLAVPSFAQGCRTSQLDSLKRMLALPQLDALQANTCRDIPYGGYQIVARTNGYGEIAHLGIRLFADSAKVQAYSHVYDFLERHLLSYLLAKKSPSRMKWLQSERVFFDTGSYDAWLGLAGKTLDFTLSCQDLKRYLAQWKDGGKLQVSMTFDMDYQMLEGCNVKQLEALLCRDLLDFRPDEGKRKAQPRIVEKAFISARYVQEGQSFIIPQIRNELYYTCSNGVSWKLQEGAESPRQSIANMMLSPDVEGIYSLRILFDRYGYVTDTLQVSSKQWLEYCKSEGCVPFFGMKTKDVDGYEGTVFMVNECCGYIHLLSVKVPKEVLKQRKGVVEARLFAFIPAHNVLGSYFSLKDYE